MIKGHTKIELFNAKTGKLEQRYEKDNLVTNAVQELIAFQTMMGRVMNNNVFPIAKNALGGIMLFDSKLDEDVNNTNFPTNVKLVGYASRDTNTDDAMRGSLNAIETHKTDTGYVSVWDFGTAQANGTIQSVALTSAYAGVNPFQRQVCGDFFCDVDVIDSKEHNGRPFLVSGEYVYWLNTDGITVQRGRFAPYSVKVADQTYGSVSIPYETVTTLELPDYESFSNIGPSKYWIPGTDGYLYLITQNNRMSSYTYYGTTHYNYYYDEGNEKDDAKFYITKYKTSDLSFEKQQEEIITLAGVHLTTRNEGWIVINKGYLYARSYDGTSIYIVNLSNTVDIKVFTFDNSGSFENMSPMLYNGGIQYQYHYQKDGNTYYRTGFLYPDATHSEEAVNGSAVALPSILYSDGKILVTYHYDGYYDNDRIRTGLRCAYLGTINNLSSPVTKNASQTMKITYTLTDKEDA
jgi:hypothetical protein